jgi:hypothetical protein
VVVNTPLLPPPSTATINYTAIGAVSSILPPLLPTTTTAIAAIGNHHCRCYTVDDNDCQKPVVIVHHQQWQWQSLSTEAAVNGGRGNGSLCRWRLLLMEVVVGWRGNDTITLAAMASLANGGGGNGGRHPQVSSGG